MVAEIKGTGSHTPSAVEPTLRKVADASPAAAAAAPTGSAVVTLTDLAARLQRLTDSVAQLPVVDQARVAAFKHAINNGTYHIDDQQIADKLTAFEALMTRAPASD